MTRQIVITRSIEVARPAAQVWDAVVDWPRHGDWVPLTSVRVLTPSALGVGARFVARTRLPGTAGRVGFDDLMEVVDWREPRGEQPGRCDVVKLGRVVRGRAWFEVSPLPAGTSLVTWGEAVAAPAPLAALVRLSAGAGLARVLRTMAQDLATSA